MDYPQIMKLGKDLGLEGKDLLDFLEKKEREHIEREERKEREKLEREDKLERERIEREEKKEKAKHDRDERAQERECKIHQQELANRNKLEVLDKEIELEKIKKLDHDKTKVDPTLKHSIKAPKLPPFDQENDNMDAYLKRFERYQESLKWPQEEWAVNLSALLRGKALEVYSRLSKEAAGNYEVLKEALLRRFQLTQEGFRQKFRACKPEVGESAPQFAIRLENYLMRWVDLSKSEKTFQGLKDLLLREQFINASPDELALFLKERKPENVNVMAELAEQYLEAHGSLDMFLKKPAGNSGIKKSITPAMTDTLSKPSLGISSAQEEKGKGTKNVTYHRAVMRKPVFFQTQFG